MTRSSPAAIAPEIGGETCPDGVDLLDHAVLGGGLAPEVERCLRAAAQTYHLAPVAEDHLRQAQAAAPDHPAVLIGLYRFYFYQGRLAEARAIAVSCLHVAARACNFALDWRLVAAGDAAFGRWDALWPRFFLFTLKGYAYLCLRLGDWAEGRAAVAKLLDLDPSDKVAAGVLLTILERMAGDDDD